MKAAVTLVLFASAVADIAAGSVNASSPGSWTKCIGDEIGKCLSCVLEDTEELVDTVIAASAGDEEETVEGVLKTLGKALQCADECSKASTKLVAKQCTSWYCKTDFCVKCCGKGSWQCLGNDFTPQCAPTMTLSETTAADVTKRYEDAKKGAATVLNSSVQQVDLTGATLVDTLRAAMTIDEEERASAKIQKCECGPGSGDPDSCCSKCSSSKDPHNVPHCPGGGKNTGPFCGNDFHVTEPNACYGDTPLCCTNDMGIPVCCKPGQVCHSPHVGNNECRNADESLVV